MRFFGLVRPCSVGAVSCCLVVVTAADRAAATCRRWGERPLLREKRLSPQPPLSRRAAGNGLVRSFGLVRPCSVGAVSCCLVMVTAADRAAATCRRWGRGASLREAVSPPAPLFRRAAGNRLVCSFGLVRPCSVGAVSCCSVVVTAADRAAATCGAERCFRPPCFQAMKVTPSPAPSSAAQILRGSSLYTS